LNFDLELDKGKYIIDAEISFTISTTKIYPEEPHEIEEGECKVPNVIYYAKTRMFSKYQWNNKILREQ
jgi:hypothetical protein